MALNLTLGDWVPKDALIPQNARDGIVATVDLPFIDVTASPYNALGDGVTDDTTAINTALAAGKHIVIPAGTFNFTQLTIANDDVTLEIMGGATLEAQDETVAMITVSGDRCRIIGTGRILSPAVFDGTNNLSISSPAVVKVSGDDFYAHGITVENVPKVGFFFMNCDAPRVEGVRINGNYPYATYSGVNTGHAAVLYDYPALASNIHAALTVTGCYIRKCVQGVLTANFTDASYLTGLTITGNHFNQCWDHGVYADSGKGQIIVGNTFLNCNAPIVTSGNGAVITGNSLYATETSQSNGRVHMVVRDAIGSVISGNTLYGLGPSILCDATNGTVVSDNVIANNTLTSTGAGVTSQAIRLGVNAETCSNNKIVGNILNVGHVGAADGAIWLTMKTNAFTGYGNEVRDNIIKVTNLCKNMLVQYQTNATISGNTIESTATAGGATTVYMMDLYQVTQLLVERNTFVWRTGGTNITVRGVQDDGVGANNTLRSNRFLFDAVMAGKDPVGLVTATFTMSRNQLTATSSFSGLFTWANGNPSVTVNNSNLLAGSRITITAMNAAAGTAISARQPYVTIVAGTSFTLQSFDGSNIVGNGLFSYQID